MNAGSSARKLGVPAGAARVGWPYSLRYKRLGHLSLVPVGDAAARQIIGRHFHAHAIAYQNPYAMLAHLAGNGSQHDVRAVVELHFKKCVGLFVDYRALRGNQIISCQ